MTQLKFQLQDFTIKTLVIPLKMLDGMSKSVDPDLTGPLLYEQFDMDLCRPICPKTSYISNNITTVEQTTPVS